MNKPPLYAIGDRVIGIKPSAFTTSHLYKRLWTIVGIERNDLLDTWNYHIKEENSDVYKKGYRDDYNHSMEEKVLIVETTPNDILKGML